MAEVINRYDVKKNKLFEPSPRLLAGQGKLSDGTGGALDTSFEEEVAWLRGMPALQDISSEDVRDFALLSRNTLALVITFAGGIDTCCTEYQRATDFGLPLFYISARLIQKFYTLSQQEQFYLDFFGYLSGDLRDDKELRDLYAANCSPGQLINHLKVAHGKTNVALFVDGTVRGLENCQSVNEKMARTLIESIASLQDDGTTSVFFTTKKISPFYNA
jgi:hypothetical protein